MSDVSENTLQIKQRFIIPKDAKVLYSDSVNVIHLTDGSAVVSFYQAQFPGPDGLEGARQNSNLAIPTYLVGRFFLPAAVFQDLKRLWAETEVDNVNGEGSADG